MATNVFRKYPGFRNEEWEVPAGTLAGEVVIHSETGAPGVTLTARGDATETVTVDGITMATTLPVGGVGNKPDCATVAVEGYEFILEVDGVDEGETVGSGNSGTAQGTAVYAIVSGGAVTGLTLTASGNTQVGVIADGRIIGDIAPVAIGVGL